MPYLASYSCFIVSPRRVSNGFGRMVFFDKTCLGFQGSRTPGGETLPEIRFGLLHGGVNLARDSVHTFARWGKCCQKFWQTFARWGMTCLRFSSDFCPVCNDVLRCRFIACYCGSNLIYIHASRTGIENVLIESALLIDLSGTACLYHAALLQHIDLVGIDDLSDVV